ncbi:fungal-specific transcription factor domain-containing protein [Aspergillus pseudoustus]|uniref:Fungal-specific transcription factor domain-containing protein n=1 Tax=Aspergillus pseudoustus TaxID=1810923 RepID=A0ABR4IQX1_9EURO
MKNTNQSTSDLPHKYKCATCGDEFKRLEHLSRHRLSHTNSRPFVCPVCEKCFTRRDSLNRHVSIHNSSSERNGKPASAPRVSRACSNCARLRLRCDGASPCKRCSVKSVQCLYVARSRTRISVVTDQAISEPAALDEECSQLSTANLPSEGTIEDSDAFVDKDTYRRESPDMATRITPHDATVATLLGTTAAPQDPCEPGGELPALEPNMSSFPSKQTTFGAPSAVDANSSPVLAQPRPADPASLPTTAVLSPSGIFGPIITPSSSVEHGLGDPAFTGDSCDFSMGLGFDSAAGWEHELAMVDWMTFDTDSYSANQLLANFSDLPPISGSSEAGSQSYPQPPQGLHTATAWVPPQNNAPARSNAPNNAATQYPVSLNNCRDGSTYEWPTDWQPGQLDNITTFPDMRFIPASVVEAEDFGHVERLSLHAYQDILRLLERTSQHQGHFKPFKNPIIPPLEVFNSFIQLYFEHFHPVFPMLHHATFDPNRASRVLVLATAAIGCRYSKALQSAVCANALQELLRRTIAHTCEQDNSQVRHLWMAQALVLNSIGMMYSGDRRLFEIAEAARNGPITLCRRNGALRSDAAWPAVDPPLQDAALKHEWLQWARLEGLKRLGFCVFLLNAQASMYLDLPSLMFVTELQQSLPCSDELWDCPDATSWKNHYLKEAEGAQEASQPNMRAMLNRLRNGQPIPSKTGTFSRLILVFAIYQSIIGQEQQLGNAFAPFCMADQQVSSAARTMGISALIALKGQTRANQNTPLGLTLECNLQLATVLLHTPRELLIRYVRSFGLPDAHHSGYREEMLRWVTGENGRKARLAVANAAALCTILRSSIYPQSFSSPLISLTAVLVVWIYNHLASSLDTTSFDPSRPAGDARQRSVRLDRLSTDDPGMSAWIKNEPGIRAQISEIGPVPRAGASLRILNFGSKLLRSLDNWGLSQGFAAWLEAFSHNVSQTVGPSGQVDTSYGNVAL